MKNRKSAHPSAFTTFSRIADQWKLTEKEQLDLLNMKSPDLLRNFKRGTMIPPEDIFRRVGYLAQIDTALHDIFSDSHIADTWIRRPNSEKGFGGRPAIELMISDISGMKRVRDYVRYQAYNGW